VNEQAPHLPIILLTGLQDEELAAAAVRQGAQDYLIKGKADGNCWRVPSAMASSASDPSGPFT